MLLFLNNGRIIGYLPDENMTDDNRKQALDNGAVEYDGELNLKNGYDLYYRNGEIVYEEVIKSEYEPINEELVQAEILLNQAEILAKQNEQDEVLAEILLNQMEV